MKKWIAVCLVAMLLVSSLSFATGTRISDYTYLKDANRSYGQLLFDLGLIKGDGKSLKEDSTLSREEMITIIYRLSNNDIDAFTAPTTPSFRDVSYQHWAYKAIEHAYKLGLTKGVGGGKFGLGQSVSYQEAVTFLLRALDQNPTFASVLVDAKASMGFYSADAETESKFLRRHIFELIAKALMEKKADGRLLIDTLSLATPAKRAAFQTGYETIQQTLSSLHLNDLNKTGSLVTWYGVPTRAVDTSEYGKIYQALRYMNYTEITLAQAFEVIPMNFTYEADFNKEADVGTEKTSYALRVDASFKTATGQVSGGQTKTLTYNFAKAYTTPVFMDGEKLKATVLTGTVYTTDAVTLIKKDFPIRFVYLQKADGSFHSGLVDGEYESGLMQ